MKKFHSTNQRGVGNVGVIFAIVIVVIAAGIGFFIFNKKENKADTAVQKAVKDAACDYADKDLCKFFAGWKTQPQFTLNTTSEINGKKTDSVTKVASKKDYSVHVGGETPYEVIYLDTVSYIKNTKDNVWYKQTNPSTSADRFKEQADVDFPEPGTAHATISYKKIGKEPCGDKDCYKYQLLDSADKTGSANYMWFDTKEFLLRRFQSASKDVRTNSTLSYGTVTVTAPSPVKELQPGQYFQPGQSQPVTLPATGDSASSVETFIGQYQ